MIFIACPPAFATGGTELLHQLAAEIRSLGGAAMMYYPGSTPADPVAVRFRMYDIPYVRSLASASAADVLVVPEVMTHLLFENQKMRRFIWWLSVDNYYVAVKAKKLKVKLRRWLGRDRVYVPGMMGFGHLAQSHYAIDFLQRNGVADAIFLSDYLNPAFMRGAIEGADRPRQNRVLFNPKKGYEFTKKVMAAAPDVDFVAIENMTPLEIAELMQSSKVYIDFGSHPGKDRIPREAAICGCCVIAGLDGAARFDEDLPLPAGFKIARDNENVPLIVEQIRRCLVDYDSIRQQFQTYREFILAEPALFGRQVNELLIKLG